MDKTVLPYLVKITRHALSQRMSSILTEGILDNYFCASPNNLEGGD